MHYTLTNLKANYVTSYTLDIPAKDGYVPVAVLQFINSHAAYLTYRNVCVFDGKLLVSVENPDTRTWETEPFDVTFLYKRV